MFDNFYKNKRVLVTGHTGFKGSWLALWLHELGAKVTGLALPPNTEPSHFELIRLQDLITHIEGDIRNEEVVRKTFEKANPEIVFHLAAQPLFRLSYDEPKMTFDTNVGGTVNILEAIRHCPSVKAAVVITSDKCYENKEWVWGYRENEPMGGHDPYSASKGCAELVFSAYLKSFFSQDATQDRTIGIRSPHAVRPWQHVLEPLSGYLQLGALLSQDPKKYSGAWNLGPEDGSYLTVAEMADRLIKCWGEGSWNDLSDPQAPHEAKLLKLNCDKAHAALHWHSVLTIDECLQMTAGWYKMFYDLKPHEVMYELCTQQIAGYMERAKKRNL